MHWDIRTEYLLYTGVSVRLVSEAHHNKMKVRFVLAAALVWVTEIFTSLFSCNEYVTILYLIKPSRPHIDQYPSNKSIDCRGLCLKIEDIIKLSRGHLFIMGKFTNILNDK